MAHSIFFIQLFLLHSLVYGQHKDIIDILGKEPAGQNLLQIYSYDSMMVDSTYSNQLFRQDIVRVFEKHETSLEINKSSKKISWKSNQKHFRFYYISVTETESKIIYQAIDEETGDSWYIQLDKPETRAILFSPAMNVRYTVR